MEILDLTVKIKWNKPSEGELPTEQKEYYVVDNLGYHRIMTYHPLSAIWTSEVGEHGTKNNRQIRCWTNLIPHTPSIIA